ncbi:MAG: glycosyltransferase [Nitrosospira sp.]|nr:glycosyltransferase [Nitrosospira sp.]
MPSPKITVSLTSFNHEKYLAEAIDSVLNQTFAGFELIIWDDASLDGSWQLIQRYADPRIKAFRNDEQRRGGYGINKTISEIARGEYIAIHHSDDVWEPEKLEKQLFFFAHNVAVGAVFTNASLIDHRGLPFRNSRHPYEGLFDQPNRPRHAWLNRFFFQGNALCHPSALVRKKVYSECGSYRLGLGQLGDFDMWIRLCLNHEIHVLPEKLVRFRLLEKERNMSGRRPEARIRLRFEYFKLLQNYRRIGTFEELKSIFPGAEKYDRGKDSDIDFALAMVALEERPFVFTELFGLDLLLELIWDPIRAERIKRFYGFDYKSIIRLTGEHDVFPRKRISSLSRWVGKLKAMSAK